MIDSDETTDEERLERLDRLEKRWRAERRFDPFMIAFAQKEWRRYYHRIYAIYTVIAASVYAFGRWIL